MNDHETIADNIVFQYGDCKILADYLASFPFRYAIITDDRIHSLYGQELNHELVTRGLHAHLFSFPHGEKNKTRKTKEELENQLLAKKFGRDTCIVALGGGVVTDLSGFIAATYCRGVSLILVPTSLMGMVDASIGGKNGVNTPYGKNLIGSFYEPLKIIIDPQFLNTLPVCEMINGIVEMIKHGLIADKEYYDFLSRNLDSLLAQKQPILEKAILESCRIKSDIVRKDTIDHGLRNVLNFGHTIGHALETLSEFSLSHGQAVAIGIIVESAISMQLGSLSTSSFENIVRCFQMLHISFEILRNISIPEIMHCLALDKKSVQGVSRFVVLTAIGKCLANDHQYVFPISPDVIIQSIEWIKNDLCSH